MVRSFIISIHALLAESDARQCYTDTTSVGFLSTLSLRRATAIGRWGTAWRDISIHALLAESDHRARDYTSPQTCISIHALLAESDIPAARRRPGSPYFYPRSPCGERPLSAVSCIPGRYFYPRSPCGERPHVSVSSLTALKISIHALLAESDVTQYAVQPSIQISIHALLAESDCRCSSQ